MYGVWGVGRANYETVANQLGADTVTTFLSVANPSDLGPTFDDAIANGLRVIIGVRESPEVAWTWTENAGSNIFPSTAPEGVWSWHGFFDTLFNLLNTTPAYQDAFEGLYIRDEPYWAGREWCVGFWTEFQMRRLRAQLREVVPGLKVYYDFGGLQWDDWARGIDVPPASAGCYEGLTYVTDQAFDILTIYDPPFLDGQEYDPALAIARIDNARQVIERNNLSIKLLYLCSAYAFSGPGYRMPTEAEAAQYVQDVWDAGKDILAGVLWYTWPGLVQYDDGISTNPQLWDEIAAGASVVNAPRWTEEPASRALKAATFVDPDNPAKKRLIASVAPLHYQDEGGVWQPADMSVRRVTNAALDGWIADSAGWHYALGQPSDKASDGWFGFGGRRGQHWLEFRLFRIGYIHWPTRTADLFSGAPTYSRANLSQETVTRTMPDGSERVAVTSATWSDLWPALPGEAQVDMRFGAKTGRLKIDVVLNQATRTWVQDNHPPATPAAETYFGVIFQIDWNDIPKIIRQAVEQNRDGDFSDDGQGIELRNALDELLAFMPLDFAYVEREDDVPATVALRKRFWQEDGNFFLLVGAPVPELAALPAGNLVFDPTIDTSIAASADDAYEFTQDTGFTYTSPTLFADSSSTASFNKIAGMRYDGLTIPAGSTIDSAISTLYCVSTSYDDPNVSIHCDDVDDSVDFATDQDVENRARTTASTNWADTGIGTGLADSPDHANALQEVVDRAGWASGQAITVIFRGNGVGGNRLQFAAYDHASVAEPAISIDYTEGGGGPVTISMDALTLASSGVSSSISPGAVAVGAGSVTLAGSLPSLVVSPGAVSVSINDLSLLSSPQDLTVVPGASSVLLAALSLVGSAETLSLIPGAISIQAGELTIASSPEDLSVTSATSVLLDVLTAVGATQDLSVVAGAVSVLMDVLSLISSTEDLTVVGGAASVLLDELSAASSADSLSVVTGAIAVLLDALSLASSAEDLTVSPGAVAILMDVLSAVFSPEDLTAGSVASILLDALSASLAIEALSVVPGATSVVVNDVSLVGSPEGLDVAPGAVAIVLDDLSITGSIEDLSAQVGEVSILLETLSAALSTPSFVVVPGDASVLLDALSLASSIEALQVAGGDAGILMNTIEIAGSTVSLQVIPGAVAIVNDSLTIIATPESLVAIATSSVALDALVVASSIEDMLAIGGAVSVVLSGASLLASPEDMTVVSGGVIALLDALGLSASLEDLTSVPGDAVVSASSAVLVGSAEGLTLVPGAITVATSSLSLVSAPQSISVTFAGLLVTNLSLLGDWSYDHSLQGDWSYDHSLQGDWSEDHSLDGDWGEDHSLDGDWGEDKDLSGSV